ncbi:transmembrane protein 272-like [Rhineura floridana]|uniref:transmembrane protein 272-like n=1 Tax=Rhineura floridana TaxID=261503 RepID=UPI002AC82D97|nr:transmembrane protein 272-like [Rhineura floridana]XP_061446384.1 transmembrane protein 272-like [Rhineura floridana]
MSEEQQDSTALLTATEESSEHSLLMVLGKIFFAALPIAGIIIGAVYLSQCPWQPLIPIYLIVLSAVVLLLLLLSCVSCGDGRGQPSTLIQGFHAACFLFLCIWFVAGNVWVYSIYPPDYEATGHPTFCQRTVFLFAFGVTTAIYVVLAVALLLALCILAGIFLFDAVLPYGGHGCRGGP